MDDLNDVRLALGAIQNRLNDIAEKVTRMERVAEVADWLGEQIDTFPERADDLIKRLESDPMLGAIVAPILAPQIRGLADDIRKRRDPELVE